MRPLRPLQVALVLIASLALVGCTQRGRGGGGNGGVSDDDDAADDDDSSADDDDAMGDDDDAADHNVVVVNGSVYDFFELISVNVDTFEQRVVCSPFEQDDECGGQYVGEWGFIAFIEEGRAENESNCWMQSELTEFGGAENVEIHFQGDEVECELPR